MSGLAYNFAIILSHFSDAQNCDHGHKRVNLICWSLTWVKSNSQARQNKMWTTDWRRNVPRRWHGEESDTCSCRTYTTLDQQFWNIILNWIQHPQKIYNYGSADYDRGAQEHEMYGAHHCYPISSSAMLYNRLHKQSFQCPNQIGHFKDCIICR
jgi:hypothetical protein